MRYLLWASVLLASVFVYAFFAGLADQEHSRFQKAEHHGCVPLTADPATVACADRRVYMLPGWVDVGPVTPVPGVPRR